MHLEAASYCPKEETLETGYKVVVHVNAENLKLRKFCVGHVGLSLEDPSGNTRYFDYGMAGSEITQVKHPILFTVGACAIIFMSVAFYSALFAIVGHMIGESSLVTTVTGAFIGAAYGTFFSPTIGMWGESKSLTGIPTAILPIPLSKEQYQNVLSYLEAHKISLYAVGFGNCLTFTRNALVQAGIEISSVNSSFLTRPSVFVQKLADSVNGFSTSQHAA